MQRAILYKRKDKYFIHASSKTTAGVWILQEPVYLIENVGEIIKYIPKVLNESREGIQHPKNWSTLFNPVLEIAGVKSYKAFINKTYSIEIEKEGTNFKFIPTKNLGHTEGFETKNNEIISLEKIDDFSEVIREAFDKSE